MILLFLNLEAQIKRDQNPNHACFKFCKAKITPGCLPLIIMVYSLSLVFPQLSTSPIYFCLEENKFSLGLSGSSVTGYCLHVIVHSDQVDLNFVSHTDFRQKNVVIKSSSIYCHPSDLLIHQKFISEGIILKQQKVCGHNKHHFILICCVIKLREIYESKSLNFQNWDFYSCTCLDILN